MKVNPKAGCLLDTDSNHLKMLQTKYVAQGFNSFKSVVHQGLIDLFQFGIEIGSKYGFIDAKTILYGRRTIADHVKKL